MNSKWLVVAGITLSLIVLLVLAGLAGWLLRGSIARVAGDFQLAPGLDWHGWGPGMMWRGPFGRQSSTPDGVLPCCEAEQSTETSQAGTLTIEGAQEAVEAYLVQEGYQGLEVDEVMEFTQNFYGIVAEEETGIGAMELLVNKETGVVSPEPGPNMMWNVKYGMQSGGMMGGSASGVMSVSGEEAMSIAQRWLDEYRPGTVTEDHADAFYGYYTLHTLRDGQISGMLSVQGSTGQVWYHNWHGDFVQMIEAHEHEGES